MERKSLSDGGDWLKTVVAFANSIPVGQVGVLFIGVKRDGQIEKLTDTQIDEAQRTLRQKISLAYPRIEYSVKTIELDGRMVIAVVVPASSQTPHFAGPSYIRVGSETVKATEEQYGRFLDRRSGPCFTILGSVGKSISVMNRLKTPHGFNDSDWPGDPHVVDCTRNYVIIKNGPDSQTFPLNQIDVSFDSKHSRLLLIVHR